MKFRFNLSGEVEENSFKEALEKVSDSMTITDFVYIQNLRIDRESEECEKECDEK